jgi:polar amino acid transport system substrate-binding protein
MNKCLRITLTYILIILFSIVLNSCIRRNIQTVSYDAVLTAPIQGSSNKIESSLTDIKSNGYVTAGVRFNLEPFGYRDEDYHLVGFDIDIAKFIANKLEIDIKYKPVTTKEMFQVLDSDEVDFVISAITHTIERDETMDFSITYFKDYERIMVPKDSNIHSLSELKGKTVALKRGISVQKGLTEKFGNSIDFYEVDNRPDDFEAMRTGLADAVATDSMLLLGLRKKAYDEGRINNLDDYVLRGEPIKEVPYGIAVKEGDIELRDTINFILIEMEKSGYYKVIFEKWFGERTPFEINEQFEIEVWP